MTKGEQERALNRDKFIADLTWEHQRKLEEESRIQSEMKRRRLLAEENRLKLLKKVQAYVNLFEWVLFAHFSNSFNTKADSVDIFISPYFK